MALRPVVRPTPVESSLCGRRLNRSKQQRTELFPEGAPVFDTCMQTWCPGGFCGWWRKLGREL